MAYTTTAAVIRWHSEERRLLHCCDVTMGAIVSQITGVSIVCWAVYSGTDQRKHQSSASLHFTGGFPSQRASTAENVSIWWRHYVHLYLSGKIIVTETKDIFSFE